MAIHTTYSHARTRLASLLVQVTKNREVVIIQRRGSEDVALIAADDLIAADELIGILETAHLLRSAENAKRLISALDSARQGKITPKRWMICVKKPVLSKRHKKFRTLMRKP